MTAAALLIALAAGALAELWSPPPYRRWPLLTLAVMLLIGATWTLTSARPELLPLLARDPAMLASGKVWRAVTALFAQDGGTQGTLFNLFWLLVLGSLAERRFSRRAWLAIYFVGGVATEFLALAWQPHGAGNSVACLALAGALCSDWREGRGRWWRAGTGLAGLAAAAVLLFANDIHGIGFVLGMTIGFVLAARSAAREREIAAANDNVVVFMPGSDTYH
jgi:membrane associated rhomboid family serine protease